ncbi:MAG: hypothetical protein RLZZ546_2586 [Bacteroidota bacterium]
MNKNEIEQYINAKYLTASEASWKLFQFPIHEESCAVQTLDVHLPGEQIICGVEKTFGSNNPKFERTTLTEFFTTMKKYKTKIYYKDMPKHFVWDEKDRTWKTRTRYVTKIGTLPNLSTKHGDVYYLKILLMTIQSPSSFDQLLTVSNTKYRTFRESCLARNLFKDPDIIRLTISDIIDRELKPNVVFNSIAELFIHNDIKDGDKVIEPFLDDLKFHAKILHRSVPTQWLLDAMRFELFKTFEEYNLNSYDSFGLTTDHNHRDIFENNNFPKLFDNINVNSLNPIQKLMYNKGVTINACTPIFLDGPGGSGKTYCIKAIINFYLKQHIEFEICASTGIAALMYPMGKTFHSLFKVKDDTVLSTPEKKIIDRIKIIKVLIIDEISMLPKELLETLDIVLQHHRNNPKLFGGIKVICAGDFRQLLPVDVNEKPEFAFMKSCKNSLLWNAFQKICLKSNMRVQENDIDSANFILDIGNGSIGPFNDLNTADVTLPSEVLCINNADDMVTRVYGEKLYEEDSMILCCTNKKCEEINRICIERLKTVSQVFSSIDTFQEGFETDVSLLHDLNPPRFPPHILEIKVGMIIMIIRNIGTDKKNGMRIKVTKTTPHCVFGINITDGPFKGHNTVVFMVKSTYTTKDGTTFSRQQLPIVPAYATTIHKSQCQSLNNVGLWLEKDEIFTHGMLYVALSRTRRGLSGIFANNTTYKSIVIKKLIN